MKTYHDQQIIRNKNNTLWERIYQQVWSKHDRIGIIGQLYWLITCPQLVTEANSGTGNIFCIFLTSTSYNAFAAFELWWPAWPWSEYDHLLLTTINPSTQQQRLNYGGMKFPHL